MSASVPAIGIEARLSQGLNALGLTLSSGQTAQLMVYLAQLQHWNRVYNLTAVRDPQQMLTHHLLDSLSVVGPLRAALAFVAAPDGSASDAINAAPAQVLDVGSGGGLPGVVLAIACPEVQVTCIDTVAKKAAFVQQMAGVLKLPNLRSVHSRVEAWVPPQTFDVVTSRAFAHLNDFVTLTRFHVKHSGLGWMAMKARQPELELQDLPDFVQFERIEPLHVPGLNEERCLVWLSAR